MFLSYALCNHDPASFPDPDEIVLDRFPNPHAAFGLGVHRCIGSNLARLDFKLMLREALRRIPTTGSTPRARSSTSRSGPSTATSTSRRPSTPGHLARAHPSPRSPPTWQAKLDAEPAPENLRAL